MAGQDLDNELVCVLPVGFVMTEAKWRRIVEHWTANGCRFLGADDVAALFKLDREPRSSK